MDIYLLRHAHSVGNELRIIDSIDTKFDLGLSEKGKKQAVDLVSTLQQYAVDIFVVSPLRRTIDTLAPYLETLESKKVIVSGLTLERNAGEFAGQDLDAMNVYCKKHGIDDRVSFRPKGGESIKEVYVRAEEFVEYLKQNFKGKSILVCGHKNFLACVEIALTDKDVFRFYHHKALGNAKIRRYIAD